MISPQRITRDLLPYLLLGACTLLLYHHSLRGYWLFDDPYNLRQTLSYPVWKFFTDPEVWHRMSLSYLTPWVNLSYALDLSLGGFSASFFYAHQIIAIWLVSALFYRTLVLFVRGSFAFFAACLFLVSAPVAAVSEMLMTRHYLEGLLFALLSLFLFITAVRGNSRHRAALSALAYGLAMSAKELYVPLVLILPFVPEGTFRSRAVLCLPHAAALGAYLVWRRFMLGTIVGGPSDEAPFALPLGPEALSFLRDNLYALARMITGQTDPAAAGPVILVAVTAALAGISLLALLVRRNWPAALCFLSASLASCALPLAAFPLANLVHSFVAYRLALLPSLSWAAAVAFAAHYVHSWTTTATPDRRIRAIGTGIIISLPAALAILVLTTASSWIAGQRTQTIRPLQQEARFFMSSGTDVLLTLREPAFTAYYYQDLAFLRKHFHHQSSPHVVYSAYVRMDREENLPPGVGAVFRYDPAKDRIEDVTKSYPLERQGLLGRIRDLPFSVSLSTVRGIVSYRLSAAPSGRYLLMMGGEPGFYTTVVQTPGTLNARGATGIRSYLRFAWESPEGLMTLSPEWQIDFSRDQEILWSRGTQAR